MLYVVSTPIGNLGDITLRALEVLKSVDVIAAEDTRHSGMLLKRFEIKKPLLSYHEHNEAMRAAQLVERLAAGGDVALITDAGQPRLPIPARASFANASNASFRSRSFPDRHRFWPPSSVQDFQLRNFAFADFCRSKMVSANANYWLPLTAKKQRSSSNRPTD